MQDTIPQYDGTAVTTAITSGYSYVYPEISDYQKRMDSVRMAIDATYRSKGTNITTVMNAAEEIYQFLNKTN